VNPDPIPAIRELPERVLIDLAQALRAERLTEAATAFLVRYAVPAVSEAAAAELSSLLASRLGPQHAALLLDALAAEQKLRADAAALELVTSGPDIAGATRDTGVVLRELFTEAEHRVLVVGFAVHQGREIFAALADRMRQRADLAVRLCLDVRRSPGDATRADMLLRRFAERFVRREWPGPRLPDLFYDPRSLAQGESNRASLHAKCVVVDGVKAFIGSANLTEAAQLRNIEIGLVVTGALIAEAVERHFEALIAGGHLQPLKPLSSRDRG
jgi:phosphatidylserine/phosphatidylglycerophosphate/cardiolipin synthase-like enzyme